MEKTYDPFAIEARWYQCWEDNNYFKPSGTSKPYCIMIPPPNVTGRLHMGHGFQQTLMDILVRYHRMLGDKTLWKVGTDHAGISTQMVVEQQLIKENSSRLEIGRENFLERVWKWRHESGNAITEQMRRLGISVDWSGERFTLDEDFSLAVQEVFISLYQEGLIYRGKRLVNWDPNFRSAISDLEVINNEEQGNLWYIRYPLVENENKFLVVATTRPETMLGDVAVAVNPNDERYQKLIGKKLRLPLCDREIPIIADDYVDMEFGSGCVKITPAHDFNDYEMGLRHKLEPINIFTEDAHINENGPQQYQGLERFKARNKIAADLEAAGLLEKVTPHTLRVPRAERGNTVVEPYLTDQWFVKVEPLAKNAVNVVESGRIKFVPENWEKTYFQWMHNIQDWCISRQLWWGHRIPAWYDKDGNIYVGRSEEEIRENYQIANITLTQEEDVLDTWFSSALWPFATLGWPNENENLASFYPTQVLVTGFDIIFYWVARMIMMGVKFMNDVPFHEVYIHGLIRDSEGQKMSKTKGNVLDPLDLIDGIDLESLVAKRTTGLMQPQMAKKIETNTRKEFPDGIPASGTDALRFTFCALATTGRDIRFDMKRLEGYRNFCNKLWNASRYVLMNLEDVDCLVGDTELSLPDQYILSRLQETIEIVRNHFEKYRFDLVASTLYEFIWNEYCDWYLELSKPVLTNPDSTPSQRRGTKQTLVTVLETLLRLLHPIMPFITEEIWQQIKVYLGKHSNTIMLEPYPEVDGQLINHSIYPDLEWIKAFILGVRNIRGEMTIAPGKKLQVFLTKGDSSDVSRLEANAPFLKTLAKLDSIAWLENDAEKPASAIALVGNLEILIPLAGLIDTDAEIKRLQKAIEKLDKDILRSESKINDEKFIANAPAEIVATEKARVNEWQDARAKLAAKLCEIESL